MRSTDCLMGVSRHRADGLHLSRDDPVGGGCRQVSGQSIVGGNRRAPCCRVARTAAAEACDTDCAKGWPSSPDGAWWSGMSPLEEALKLADGGVAVFPCRADKRPACAHGFHDAVRDPAAVHDLWRQSPGPLIGVPTGFVNAIDVLDVDLQHGGDKWLQAQAARLPATRTHRTRSGGWHYLFRHQTGVRNSEGRVAPGVDIRGEGGFIIFWPAAGLPILNNARPAQWPTWLLEQVLPKPVAVHSQPAARPMSTDAGGAERMLARAISRVETAGPGQRHHHLRAAACTVGGLLDAAGLSEGDAVAMLMGAVLRAGGGAVDQRNASATIRWGLDRGRSSPLDVGGWNAG
jgi:hypothetical protein